MKPESDELDELDITAIADHADLNSLRIYTVRGYTDLYNLESMCKALGIKESALDSMVTAEMLKDKK